MAETGGVVQEPWRFTTWLDLFDHWQTIIAGASALLAAIGTLLYTLNQDRKSRKAIYLSLAAEIRVYLDMMLVRHENIRRHTDPDKLLLGRDLRALAELPPPVAYPATADRIGLLGTRIAAGVADFYATRRKREFRGADHHHRADETCRRRPDDRPCRRLCASLPKIAPLARPAAA
jgi:hypothetical protein